MLRAADVRAMRRSLERLEPIDGLAADLRRFFTPHDAVVRLAAEMAIDGGGSFMPRDPSPAWVSLAASGWLHTSYRPGSEVTLNVALLEEFRRESAITQ
jgi:hypothetical protein